MIEYKLYLDDEGFVYKKYKDLAVYVKYQSVDDYCRQSLKDGIFVKEELVETPTCRLKELYYDQGLKIKEGYRFTVTYDKDGPQESVITTDINGLIFDDGMNFKEYLAGMKIYGIKIKSQEPILKEIV